MPSSPRRQLSYAGLLALLVLDLAALVSFLIVQLLGAPIPVAWIAAAILTGLAVPELLRWVDTLFSTAPDNKTIPQAGESFL